MILFLSVVMEFAAMLFIMILLSLFWIYCFYFRFTDHNKALIMKLLNFFVSEFCSLNRLFLLRGWRFFILILFLSVSLLSFILGLISSFAFVSVVLTLFIVSSGAVWISFSMRSMSFVLSLFSLLFSRNIFWLFLLLSDGSLLYSFYLFFNFRWFYNLWDNLFWNWFRDFTLNLYFFWLFLFWFILFNFFFLFTFLYLLFILIFLLCCCSIVLDPLFNSFVISKLAQ